LWLVGCCRCSTWNRSNEIYNERNAINNFSVLFRSPWESFTIITFRGVSVLKDKLIFWQLTSPLSIIRLNFFSSFFLLLNFVSAPSLFIYLKCFCFCFRVYCLSFLARRSNLYNRGQNNSNIPSVFPKTMSKFVRVHINPINTTLALGGGGTILYTRY